MREFKVGKVYLDTDYNTEVKVEIIGIENNHIYFSGYEKIGFFREHNGFYKFALDIRLEYLISGRYKEVLKIGDTFEYNGFVCRVESGVEKWYYNTRTDKYVRTKHYGRHLKEITNKEFIKQLEENAR